MADNMTMAHSEINLKKKYIPEESINSMRVTPSAEQTTDQV